MFNFRKPVYPAIICTSLTCVYNCIDDNIISIYYTKPVFDNSNIPVNEYRIST